MSGDDGTDTALLTYQELAARLGIDLRSAKRRVLRSGWARLPGNDGRVRVSVPVSILPPVGPDISADIGLVAGPIVSALIGPTKTAEEADVGPTRGDLARLLSLLEDANAALRGRLGEMAKLRERLGRAEGEAAAVREEARRLRAERDAARAEAEAWTAGGPLARAWRAFLNRRARP
jgi:hypothetical protein